MSNAALQGLFFFPVKYDYQAPTMIQLVRIKLEKKKNKK